MMLSRVFAVESRGVDLFRAVERLDLEGILDKRLRDRYAPDVEWRKIRNDACTEEGRGELYHPKPR